MTDRTYLLAEQARLQADLAELHNAAALAATTSARWQRQAEGCADRLTELAVYVDQLSAMIAGMQAGYQQRLDAADRDPQAVSDPEAEGALHALSLLTALHRPGWVGPFPEVPA